MITLRADDVPPTPWKNGGGISRDLLCWPGTDDWRVRISLADIARDGPFSDYPGVTRWFAVVEGPGVALQFADGARELRAGDAPLVFDGAAAPGCRLLAGPTRDLNLMLRGGATGTLQRGIAFAENWPLRGRFDPVTNALTWALPPGLLHSDTPVLWIGVAP